MKHGKLKYDVPALLKRLDDAGIEVTDAYSSRMLRQHFSNLLLFVHEANSDVREAIRSQLLAFVSDVPVANIWPEYVIVQNKDADDDILVKARAIGRDVLGVKLRRFVGYQFGSLRFYRLLGTSAHIRDDQAVATPTAEEAARFRAEQEPKP